MNPVPLHITELLNHQIRHLGFEPLHVDIPFDEAGIYISTASTALVARLRPLGVAKARLMACAPRMLALLEQALAALPDRSFASRCQVPADFVDRTTTLVNETKKAPADADHDTEGYRFYPEGEKYAVLFANAQRMLTTLIEIEQALPSAWQDFEGAPNDLINAIAQTIRESQSPEPTNPHGL